MNRRNLLKTILSLPALLFVKPEPEYKFYRTYTCATNDCSCCCSHYEWTSKDSIIRTCNDN